MLPEIVPVVSKLRKSEVLRELNNAGISYDERINLAEKKFLL